MEKKKWDWLLIALGVIALWAIAFCVFVLTDSGRAAAALGSIVAVGLVACIPLGVVCLAAMAKGRISARYSALAVALSILNFCIGAASWAFFVLLMRMP